MLAAAFAPAHAQVMLDLSKVTCDQWAGYKITNPQNIALWLSGYYNGKRGNTSDPSHDVVDYNYGGQPDEGTTDVYIVDVISGHCGGNPGPAWIDQTEATRNAGAIGRWTGRGRF